MEDLELVECPVASCPTPRPKPTPPPLDPRLMEIFREKFSKLEKVRRKILKNCNIFKACHIFERLQYPLTIEQAIDDPGLKELREFLLQTEKDLSNYEDLMEYYISHLKLKYDRVTI